MRCSSRRTAAATRRARWLALASLVALGLLAIATPSALAGSKWAKVTSMGKIGGAGEVGLQRTADGALHVLWPREVDQPPTNQILHSAIPANGKGVLGPNLVYSNSSSLAYLNPSVDLVAGPGGGLRAFFTGQAPAAPYNDVMATATAHAAGTIWSAPAAASNNASTASDISLAHGISAAVSASAQPISVWGSPGSGIHFGINPAASDRHFPGTDCCVADPAVGVDAASGAIVAAWYDQGAQELKVLGSFGTHVVPGSANLVGANGDQRTAIGGRIGAGGVYVAYIHVRKNFEEDPALWRVGAAKATAFKPPEPPHACPEQGFDADLVTIAPAPGGRLWIAWERDGCIFATRTNPAASRFGRIVSVKPPKGTQVISGLNAEGSRGPLDVLANIKRGKDSDANYWHRRLLPGLSFRAKPKQVRRGKKVRFRVTDAGAAVGKAKVMLKLGHKKHAARTNAKGKAAIKVPKGTKPRRYRATARKGGYAKAALKVKVDKR